VLLPLQCVLMPATLVVAGPDLVRTATLVWFVGLGLQLLAALGFSLVRLWPRARGAALLTAGVTAGLALGAALTAAGAAGDNPALLAAGQLLAPGALMLAAAALLQRPKPLEAPDNTRALVEQRVAEVRAEIEANYRQLSELRVVQVTDRERKRIAADLHDDLGAKLLTIVHTSESERISTLAREALEEMRLSVRGLTGKPVRLEDALGDWRAEVISRLGQAGIEAVWNMPTDELPQTLPARAFVQTTRIIREAVNNIIKHSGASQCAVRCQVSEGDFQLVIQDNGKGISDVVDGRLDRGHGLSTMKGRAKQLQGQCLVESGPGYGTVIRLTVPLEPSAPPA
jgi:two-component system, NarL family, sensor histidine kinase UhpB